MILHRIINIFLDYHHVIRRQQCGDGSLRICERVSPAPHRRIVGNAAVIWFRIQRSRYRLSVVTLERQNEIRQFRLKLPTRRTSHTAQPVYFFAAVIPDYAAFTGVTHSHANTAVWTRNGLAAGSVFGWREAGMRYLLSPRSSFMTIQYHHYSGSLKRAILFDPRLHGRAISGRLDHPETRNFRKFA